MEVLIRNLPNQTSEGQLERFLRPILANLSIRVFACRKMVKPGVATVTFLHLSDGHLFLHSHGQQTGTPHAFQIVRQLRYMTRNIYFSPSRNAADPYLLRILQDEEENSKKKIVPKVVKVASKKLKRKFGFSVFACGLWDYLGFELNFSPYFQDLRGGSLLFGKTSLALLLGEPAHYRIEVPFSSIQSITIGTEERLSLTMTLTEAPKTYKIDNIEDPSLLLLLALRHDLRRSQAAKSQLRRISCIDDVHGSIFASCFVYQIQLSATALDSINALKRIREIPKISRWPTTSIDPRRSYAAEQTRLSTALATQYGDVPFSLQFQMQRLVQNGYLSPAKVTELLPAVSQMWRRSSVQIGVDALRKVFNQIPFPGPGAGAEDFKVSRLVELLKKNEVVSKEEHSYLSTNSRNADGYVTIHKATVTPAGTYLYGPDQEPLNRVLRIYTDYRDYFLKVTFADEDGDPIRFSSSVSNEVIYHKRFKKVLDGVLNIAGRGFEFLGFSHSSLRAQSCWFMAPFTHNGELLHARAVIAKIGDFSGIHSPARCAARIGQAFSDTLIAVSIPIECVNITEDVERSGRTFSDGCGLISHLVHNRICKLYAQSRKLKPTLFQIRFAGAKGMISVDPRLEGDALTLRPSMVKFTGSKASEIEICGSAIRPLPFYLNRQIIKILEDLGVQHQVFLGLQERAVERLRSVTRSPINAATFLTRSHIADAARVPWLIEKLNDMGLSFEIDGFLRDVLELAILVQLRALKYRSRILVEDALTVYGIMDETGCLEEGEIFCVVETESEGRSIITGHVAVTRSPALHPGDIQYVQAVDVPRESPLQALHNCVVFSQKGWRDLPSQLSGGDLDGDLYNIIYHPGLLPSRVEKPADYPRVAPVDIGTKVERSHMTDFFIRFMENDQLGRIATLHQVLADQRDLGTLDPDCLLLANKHSTAVDFSKTGIPVDLNNLPRYNRYKPDFMAPGPRITLEQGRPKFDDPDDGEQEDEDEDENLAASPMDTGSMRYYKSDKVLGKLYRAIDEEAFFTNLQVNSGQSINASASDQSLLLRLWAHVEKRAALIQWTHHSPWAREIRDMYDEYMVDTMSQYSLHPLQYLSEVEVFAGDIVGRYGPQSKRQREASVTMKEKFDRDVAFIIDCIVKEDENGARSEESLPRSMACLAVAISEERPRRKVGSLHSFGYVAAVVCLKELENFEKDGLYSMMAPSLVGKNQVDTIRDGWGTFTMNRLRETLDSVSVA